MRTITEIVRAAVNRAPETFTMPDLTRIMRALAPLRSWSTTTPYHVLEELEAERIVRVKPGGSAKTWQRLRKSAEQAELDLAPPAAPAPAAAASAPVPNWKPIKRGRVLRAVREIVFNEFRPTTSTIFFADDVERRIRQRWPALAEQMSGGAVRSALVNLERRKYLERAPRVGTRTAWRRIR